MFKLIIIAIIFSGCFAQENKQDLIQDLNNTQMKVTQPECFSASKCCFTDKVTFTVNYNEKQIISSFTLTGNQNGENCPGSYTILPCGEYTSKTSIYNEQILVKYEGVCYPFLLELYQKMIINEKCPQISGKSCFNFQFDANKQNFNSYFPSDACEAMGIPDPKTQTCKQDTFQVTSDENKQKDKFVGGDKSNGNNIFLIFLYLIIFFML